MSSLKKNIIYSTGYQILTLIVPIITAPYVSRVLGKDGLGLYGYTYSIAHYFVLFCMLGILNYGNREISMVSNNKSELSSRFWQIYLNQLSFGVISLLIYYIYIYNYVQSFQQIYVIQSLYVISGIIDISWFYFGIEKFKTTTTISSINKVITTILIFGFVRTSSDIWIYALILAGGTLMNNIVYWLLLNKFIDKWEINIKESMVHLKPLLLLFIPVIAVNIYKYIDKIMLGSMVNVGEVGIFEAAEKLTNIPMGFIAAFGTVMLPRVSNMLNSKEFSKVKRYNNLSLNVVMFLSCGMAFGLAGISDVFVSLFYGSDFVESHVVLLYLCPCMLFVSWANVIRTQYLLPNRKDSLFCISVISGAIVNIIANIILIPLFGSIGAAISTLIAEMIVCFLQSALSYKEMELRNSLIAIFPFFLIGFLTYFVITKIDFHDPFVTVLCRISLGAMIYIILSIFFLNKNVRKIEN